ncbi:ketopantoate reductase family protein [Shewanella kaireitica]|uniref:ketopantoate reductase family protein n=1 Tax=Shewanella kaireitica TaxID=212021 RepID=UPI00200DC8A6|nr:2-dehydropantoate 2-reductase [Shewanella kaireitica]MCL1092688.1 2-dehydropantoate 2-reductase [Shewanella kaireitica]
MSLISQSAADEIHTQPQISIVGAGAVGQLIYQQLSTANNSNAVSINFIRRTETSQQQSLTFTNLEQQSTTRIAEFVGSNDWTHQLLNTQLLIVCVKAYQVVAALKPIIKLLSPNCHILLLHNGLGPHLDVSKMLNGQGLSLGTTSQGALKKSTWHTQQTGQGVTQLGHFTGPMLHETIKKSLLSSIPQSQWFEDILPMLWQKLAINVAINPMTAIHDCRNGELAASQYRNTITAAVTELAKVAAAESIMLDLEGLITRVYQVIELTAANYSSMHQDVHHQRKTEIEAINGFVVQMANRHGKNAKTNEQLLANITALEQGYSNKT